MGSQWARLDLLAGPGLLSSAWPRLCTGYLVDAIGRKPQPWHRLEAGHLLSKVARARASPRRRVGLGEEYRLGTPGLAGATLVVQGRVHHLMAFPVAEARKTQR